MFFALAKAGKATMVKSSMFPVMNFSPPARVLELAKILCRLPLRVRPAPSTQSCAPAGNAAKTGRSTEVNQVLSNVRSVLQSQRQLVKETFEGMDTDRDGCLRHLDVVRLIKMFVQGELGLVICFHGQAGKGVERDCVIIPQP